jgi:hypothetical protein
MTPRGLLADPVLQLWAATTLLPVVKTTAPDRS